MPTHMTAPRKTVKRDIYLPELRCVRGCVMVKLSRESADVLFAEGVPMLFVYDTDHPIFHDQVLDILDFPTIDDAMKCFETPDRRLKEIWARFGAGTVI